MEKLKRIKKNVLVEAAVAAAVVAVFVGIYFLVDSFVTSTESDETKVTGEVRTLDAQIAEEERKVGIVKSSIAEYNEIKAAMDAKQFALDRTRVEETLTKLKTQYRLSNFTASIAPEATTKGAAFDGKRVGIIYSDVKLAFSAISDVHVFSFFDALKTSLPGFIRVTKFSLKRDKKMDASIFVSLNKGEDVPLVQASVEFKWLGLKIIEKTPDPNAAAASPPAPAGE